MPPTAGEQAQKQDVLKPRTAKSDAEKPSAADEMAPAIVAEVLQVDAKAAPNSAQADPFNRSNLNSANVRPKVKNRSLASVKKRVETLIATRNGTLTASQTNRSRSRLERRNSIPNPANVPAPKTVQEMANEAKDLTTIAVQKSASANRARRGPKEVRISATAQGEALKATRNVAAPMAGPHEINGLHAHIGPKAL
jgi:hypothetical protein